MRRFHGTFTNREILVWFAIVTAFWFIVELHWIGLVFGIVAATLSCWCCRDTINSYRIRPSIVRWFRERTYD